MLSAYFSPVYVKIHQRFQSGTGINSTSHLLHPVNTLIDSLLEVEELQLLAGEVELERPAAAEAGQAGVADGHP